MTNDLYIISSVFHLLIATAVASTRPGNKAYWVFSRFNLQRLKVLQSCLIRYVNSIDDVLYLDDSKSSVKQRKKNSKVLLEFAQRREVSNVFVGNDRHVEFQFLVYSLKKQNTQLRAIYLDEGLYSYIGRKASTGFSERIIDQTLKRLVYGVWWQTPKTIGASNYIDEVWLAYPNQACSFLQAKHPIQLPVQGFDTVVFKQFINCWGRLFDLPENLHDVDFILTITDEKNFAKFPSYINSIKELVIALATEDFKIAVKYHPNANQQDLLELGRLTDKVIVLPSDLPFEVLLPLLSKATLIAEFSSTLLTSKLLNPKMRVCSITHANQNVPPELSHLFKAIQIESMSIEQLKQQIKVR